MSAYCIKVSEPGDFLTSVFKQEQYMSIFLAAHVLLVSVLNPCFLLHAHFFCAPRKNIDWKTAFYSFCYFRMLLFIELLNPSLLCSTLRSAVTATLTLQISPHATGQCLFLYSCCLHWMYIDWKIRFYNTCCLLMLPFLPFSNSFVCSTAEQSIQLFARVTGHSLFLESRCLQLYIYVCLCEYSCSHLS